MRRAPDDDLEVLPVATGPFEAVGAFDLEPDDDRAPRPRRRLVGAGFAALVVVVAVAAVVVIADVDRDDPVVDTRVLVDTWARTVAVGDVADRASVRVRILVPTRDVATTFRALGAVRSEERDRLRAIAHDVTAVGTDDVIVARARGAIGRALSVRERRARSIAAFYAAGGSGVRNVESIERGMATTTREVDAALERLRRRYPVSDSSASAPPSLALARALGALARVADDPVGARLLLNVDGRLTEFDPDATAAGRVRAVVDMPSLRTLVTLGDGTVLTWGANSEVRVVDTTGARPTVGPTLAYGRPVPAATRDAVWIVTGNETTKVSLDGTTLTGPFRLPVDQIVADTRRGLLVFDPGLGDQPAVGLWSPPDPAVRPLVNGIFLAADHGRLVTATCNPSTWCTLRVTDVATGATRDVAPPGPGNWNYGAVAMSPDGRWVAAGARNSGVEGGLLFVDLRTLDTHLLRVPSQAEDMPGVLTWDASSTRVFAVNERGKSGMWATPRGATLRPIRFQVAFDDLIRVRDLAVVETDRG